MTKKDNDSTKALTRKELRDALLGNKTKPESELITVFSMEIELRQPTLAVIMKSRDDLSNEERVADMIVEYAYVPGTDEKVFEKADRQAILQWPFGKDLTELQNAITRLTGLDVEATEAQIESDPLAKPSSSTA